MDIGPKRDVLGELKEALTSRQPGIAIENISQNKTQMY
jgi:hypothetical protein